MKTLKISVYWKQNQWSEWKWKVNKKRKKVIFWSTEIIEKKCDMTFRALWLQCINYTSRFCCFCCCCCHHANQNIEHEWIDNNSNDYIVIEWLIIFVCSSSSLVLFFWFVCVFLLMTRLIILSNLSFFSFFLVNRQIRPDRFNYSANGSISSRCRCCCLISKSFFLFVHHWWFWKLNKIIINFPIYWLWIEYMNEWIEQKKTHKIKREWMHSPNVDSNSFRLQYIIDALYNGHKNPDFFLAIQ